MEFWEEVKRDVQKGIKEGLALVKAGASIAVRKVDELTQESKRRLQSFDIKTKVHTEVAELGARVYKLWRDGALELTDTRARTLARRISRLEDQIAGLEAAPEGGAKAVKKKAAKKAAKKTAAKKTAKKSAGKTTAKKRTPAAGKTAARKKGSSASGEGKAEPSA